VGDLLLAVDLGTTSLKACLYAVGESLGLRATTRRAITLRLGADGTAEQDPQQWWEALASAVPELLTRTATAPSQVRGVTFCSQMQCLVLVDAAGVPVRPALSYLDQRATRRMAALTRGGPRIAGIGAGLLVPWLRVSGGVAASVKDPLWKYLRVADEEPEAFARAHRWLDAKDYLTARCTGRFTMSTDSAFATFLADTRHDACSWSPWLVGRFGVRAEHLPEIVPMAEIVGELSATAAEQLGLAAGTRVLAGGGDASLIGVGAGAVRIGDTHVYVGTSGWVSTVADRRIVDARTMMATVPGAEPGHYNYFGEQETSGKCFEWAAEHLFQHADQPGGAVGSNPSDEGEPTAARDTPPEVIDRLMNAVTSVPTGSGGVLFAPWLHGSRSPFEDPNVRGMFFNVGLTTGQGQLARSVIEGIAYNKRLLLEAQARKVTPSPVLRFAGGGAASDTTGQILADVLDRPVEAVSDPQLVGAAGAALVAAWGLGLVSSLREAAETVQVRRRFEPDPATRAIHDANFAVFRDLYPATKSLFARLNGGADRA
jgi:xylulokinase